MGGKGVMRGGRYYMIQISSERENHKNKEKTLVHIKYENKEMKL